MSTRFGFVLSVLTLVAVLFPQTGKAQPPPTSFTVVVCDGDGHPMTGKTAEVIIRDDKSGQRTHNFYQGEVLKIIVPDFDGSSQSFTISAHAPGYAKAVSRHVRIEKGSNVVVSFLMVPHHPSLDMEDAHWQNMAFDDPQLLSRLLCDNQGPSDCSATYETMLKLHPENLAALINISVALQQIQIGGRSAFSYYQSIGLGDNLFRDRFFAYVDKALLLQLKADTDKKQLNKPAGDTPFARLHLSWILHRHATSSFKELDLDKANVQITFNERDTQIINGVECIRVDTDIDYYRRFKHGFREVIPNLITHRRSSPLTVFKLRWTATKKEQSKGGDIADFSPRLSLKAKERYHPHPPLP
jgi:hypothetical protein